MFQTCEAELRFCFRLCRLFVFPRGGSFVTTHQNSFFFHAFLLIWPKIEAAQRRAARWASRNYWYTSHVSEMFRNLNWCPLEQRRIDSRLLMMYKITYDLVAISGSDYLIPNCRESRFIHPLAYRQIRTSKWPPWPSG